MKTICHRFRRLACLWGALLSASSFVAIADEASIVGAWSVDCQSGKEQCVANQLVLSQQKTVLGVMVSYIEGHPAPHIVFRTTPNANIQKGAAVKIDENSALNVPITRCDTNICEVKSFIPKGLLNQMINGQNLKFAFFVDDKQYVYPVSLNGFSVAIDKVSGQTE